MRPFYRIFFVLIGLGLLMPGVMQAQPATRGQASLWLEDASAPAGETTTAGILLKLPTGYHSYWLYAGESGFPTTVEWELPSGWKAGAIQWPIPRKKVDTEVGTSYELPGDTLLLVPLEIAPDAKSGEYSISGKVDWLECEKDCVPGSGTVTGTLKVGARISSDKQPAFLEARKRLSSPPPSQLKVTASWGSLDKEARPLVMRVEGLAWDQYDFFPTHVEGYLVEGGTVSKVNGGMATLTKRVQGDEGKFPLELSGWLVGNGGKVAHPVTFAVSGTVISGSESNSGSSTGSGILPPAKSLWAMLALAFLGGIILNVMPCVLPVIALKIFGFVQQSHESPKRVRQFGLLYGLGVLASFLVLAGLVLLAKFSGGEASWGMQMENPFFVLSLTVLMLAVALNLFGVYEINLGGKTMQAAGNLSAKEGPAGAFFNGILATLLATPCTAPALATALGFAFVQPPIVIVLFFLTVGLGLAFPYVLLSWFPAWLRFLPKPGAWMEKFKVAMGFPVLLTAVWLFDVFLYFYPGRSAFWPAVAMVLFALALWVFGAFVQRGRSRKLLSGVIALGLVALAFAYPLNFEFKFRQPGELAKTIDWQPWSLEAIAKAQSEGRPVLVDFTAEWCQTCKWNKKTAIDVAPVRERIRALNAVTLKADYTLRPPAMTQELRRFQRAGVPLVLVYPGRAGATPVLLPDGPFTRTTLLKAFDEATGKETSAR